MYLGMYLPLITRRPVPSMEPSVPSSAMKNWKRCSGLRFIILQISAKFTQSVFLVPTRMSCGGLSVCRRFSWSSGFFAWRISTTRSRSVSYE